MSDPLAAATQVAATKAGDDEQIAYWARRWQTGNTQWHKEEVHPAVLQHSTTQLQCAAAAAAVRDGKAPASSAPTILVPLCGKAVDLLHLYQQGYRVVGIEIVTQAIIDFFYEQSATFPTFRAEKIAGTGFYRYIGGTDDRLQILQADIFSPLLTRELVGGDAVVSDGLAAVWDRASMVAVQPAMRSTYITTIKRLCGPRTQILLNVFCYDQSAMSGPPFSVTDAHLAELLPAAEGWNIKLLESGPAKAGSMMVTSNDYIIHKKE